MYRKIMMVLIAAVISNLGVIVQVIFIKIFYIGFRSIVFIDIFLGIDFEKRTFC